MHCLAGSLHPLHWGRLWAAGPTSSGTPCSQHPGGMPARAGGWGGRDLLAGMAKPLALTLAGCLLLIGGGC